MHDAAEFLDAVAEPSQFVVRNIRVNASCVRSEASSRPTRRLRK